MAATACTTNAAANQVSKENFANKKNASTIVMDTESAKITSAFALKVTSAKTAHYMNAPITARSTGIATAKQASAPAT